MPLFDIFCFSPCFFSIGYLHTYAIVRMPIFLKCGKKKRRCKSLSQSFLQSRFDRYNKIHPIKAFDESGSGAAASEMKFCSSSTSQVADHACHVNPGAFSSTIHVLLSPSKLLTASPTLVQEIRRPPPMPRLSVVTTRQHRHRDDPGVVLLS
jgi:hypothetical protein